MILNLNLNLGIVRIVSVPVSCERDTYVIFVRRESESPVMEPWQDVEEKACLGTEAKEERDRGDLYAWWLMLVAREFEVS